VRKALLGFADSVYFHQVIESRTDGTLVRYRDLDVALNSKPAPGEPVQWRIHFHIPLHAEPTAIFGNTSDHIVDVLDMLRQNPSLCSHLPMETYTWEVMPPELKNRSVVEQLVSEYEWTLARLG